MYLAIFAGFLVGTIGIAIYFSSPETFGGKLRLENVDDQVQEGYGIASASLGDIEVSGVRTWWDAEAEKIKVRAVVVNHGDRPKSNVDLKVHVRPLDSDLSTPPLASFDLQLDGELGPRESRDVESELASLAHPSALPRWSETRIELEEQ